MEEILLGEFSDWRKKSKENKMFLEKSTRSKRFWENKIPRRLMSGMKRSVENRLILPFGRLMRRES